MSDAWESRYFLLVGLLIFIFYLFLFLDNITCRLVPSDGFLDSCPKLLDTTRK
jgi:hypothetical protein